MRRGTFWVRASLSPSGTLAASIQPPARSRSIARRFAGRLPPPLRAPALMTPWCGSSAQRRPNSFFVGGNSGLLRFFHSTRPVANRTVRGINFWLSGSFRVRLDNLACAITGNALVLDQIRLRAASSAGSFPRYTWAAYGRRRTRQGRQSWRSIGEPND